MASLGATDLTNFSTSFRRCFDLKPTAGAASVLPHFSTAWPLFGVAVEANEISTTWQLKKDFGLGIARAFSLPGSHDGLF